MRHSEGKYLRSALCLGAALALALLPAAGCRRSAPGNGVRELAFAYQNRVGSAPCIIAHQEGFFEDEGLRVRAMRFNSGPACSEALFSGSAQVATMGDATAVIAVARNPSLRIVASHAAGEHRHRLVGGKGLAYNGPRDLRGKTLAVKKGTSTYGGLLAFLAAHGIAPDELRIINLRPSEMPEALMAGSIDCFVASEPTPSLAETRGAAPLETLGGLDNNYPIMIVAHEQVVAARPNDLRALLRALHRAVKFMREQPDRALTIVSEATGLPPAAAASAMQRHSYGVNLDAVTMGSLGRTAAFLADQRVVPAAPDLPAASTPNLLPQEAPRRKQNTAQSLGGDR